MVDKIKVSRVVNRAILTLHKGSLEITLTVPLMTFLCLQGLFYVYLLCYLVSFRWNRLSREEKSSFEEIQKQSETKTWYEVSHWI